MSVIIGIINNGKVILACDTLLSNKLDISMRKNGQNKIFDFELDEIRYLIGMTGKMEDILQFQTILSKHLFSKLSYSSLDFANELHSIIKINNINHLNILLGCNTMNTPYIFKIGIDSFEHINQEFGYNMLLPNSCSSKNKQIDEILQMNSHLLLKNNGLDLLRLAIREVGIIDKFRFVNDDFYYKILDETNQIIKPPKSDKGYYIK